MISSNNIAANHTTNDADFTIENYRILLKLAKCNWPFVQYHSIPWNSSFILWRHDIDYSLNRSLELAKIEYQEGVKATYFVNPNSEYYNLAELGQNKLIQQILSYGHDLGLHFDAAFNDISDEQDLNRLVANQARYLTDLFGVTPSSFSFHNPIESHLAYDKEKYGDLINCYSTRFKKEVAYCSDSNGYWRFKRLHDVLAEASDSCLQVLTHPGWWQEKPMPPRQRIFRSVFGRAVATMQHYDDGLLKHSRKNHTGKILALEFLKDAQPDSFKLCDYLWNEECFQTLFLELCRLHALQINRICRATLHKEWGIPANEVNILLRQNDLFVGGYTFLYHLFDRKILINEIKFGDLEFESWIDIRNQIINGHNLAMNRGFENSCESLCQLINAFSIWGLQQNIAYNGLATLESIGFQSYEVNTMSLEACVKSVNSKIPCNLDNRWRKLKFFLLTQPNKNQLSKIK